MTILFETETIPEKGQVDLKVEHSFKIKVTADEARQQVKRWLLNEVSYMIGADTPTLVIGERVVWRVPAYFSTPDFGRVGIVGMVDVDVSTGQMNNTLACKVEIERCAEALADCLPPYQPKDEVPAQYIAKNVPAAPKLVLHENKAPTIALV